METLDIESLKIDDNNLNNHTVRGLGLLSHSLDKYGAGRPILLDRHNKVIAGNAVVEYASESGIDEVVIVDAADDELVVVQRKDLDLSDAIARELAFADNRISELNLEWNREKVDALFDEIDISEFWQKTEEVIEPEKEENAPEIIENDVVLYQLKVGKYTAEITHDEMQQFKEIFTGYVNRTGTSYGFVAWLLNLEADND